MSRLESIGAVSALLLVSGCVGGGSNDDPTIRVTFSPSTITKSFSQGDELTSGMPFVMTLSRAPDGPSFIRVQPLAPLFEPEPFLVDRNASGTTTMLSLMPSCALAPAQYAGTVTVDLCRDQACTGTYPLAGNALAYRVTVSPGFLVTATVDGVPEPGFKTLCGVGGLGGRSSGYDFGAMADQTVRLESTVPVTWDVSLTELGCGLTLDAVSSTETSWTAVIRSADAGYGCGYVYVDATLSPSDWIPIDIAVGPW